MPDRLTVKGFGDADGSYEFDLGDLTSINGPEAFTNREQHQIKLATGYRGIEVGEAITVLDPQVMIELVAVLTARGGKQINKQRLWDTKFLYTSGQHTLDLDDYKRVVVFHLEDAEPSTDGEDDEEGVADDPPV